MKTLKNHSIDLQGTNTGDLYTHTHTQLSIEKPDFARCAKSSFCHSEGFSPKNLPSTTQTGCITGVCHSELDSESLVPLSFLERQRNKESYLSQSGRSMVEMLGVLALMGVLGVAAVAGFRTMMDKHMANTILEDAQVAFIEINSQKDGAPTEWTEKNQNFKPVSQGVTFSVKRDPLKNDYVLVSGIEERVCRQLLSMRTEDKLNFFEEEGFDEFITCTSPTNNIVFAFNGQLAPAECGATTDCDVGDYDTSVNESGFPGYCTSTGRCKACEPEKYEIVNNDRTGCECNEDYAISCSTDEGDSWCCERGTLCGWSAGECVADNGCWSVLGLIQRDNRCHYTLGTETRANKCHYSLETTTKSNKCHYTLSIDEDNNATMTKDSTYKCSDDEYCYLQYSGDNCTGSDNAATELWGACNDVTTKIAVCSYTDATMTEDSAHKCSDGEYCYLQYTESNCTGSDNAATELWGACNDVSSKIASCSYTAATMTKDSAHQCSDDEYCYLQYSGDNCSDSDNAAIELWGACNDVTTKIASCSYTDVTMTPKKSCPPSYYCYLGWTNETCTATDNAADTIYGRCSDVTKKASSCPTNPEWDKTDSIEE